MQFTVAQPDLVVALRLVARAVSARNTIPVLSGVLLEALDQRLRLRATDLEVAIETTLPADVVRAGATVLPGRYLQELVRRLPPGPVGMRLAQENCTVRLTWEDAESVIHGFPAEQFPSDGASEHAWPALEMAAGDLASLLRETGFATGHDESRPWFTGIFLHVQGEQAIAMATDAAVIAYSQAPVHNPADLRCSVILPGRSLQELGRLLPETGTVRVLPSQNRFRFELGTSVLTTRLLEGQYPDFRSLLPAHYPSTVTVNRERFLLACERAALAANQNGVRVEASPHSLRLSARTPEIGAVTEKIPATVVGDGFAIPLNVHYVLNGLRSMTCPDLLVEFSGPRSAVRFRSGPEAAAYFAVLPLLSF